jgi:hypothetical protein
MDLLEVELIYSLLYVAKEIQITLISLLLSLSLLVLLMLPGPASRDPRFEQAGMHRWGKVARRTRTGSCLRKTKRGCGRKEERRRAWRGSALLDLRGDL